MKELNCWVGCFGLLEKKSNNGRVLPLTYDMDFKKGPDAFFNVGCICIHKFYAISARTQERLVVFVQKKK